MLDRYCALLAAFETEHGHACASHESPPEIEEARTAALAEHAAALGDSHLAALGDSHLLPEATP